MNEYINCPGCKEDLHNDPQVRGIVDGCPHCRCAFVEREGRCVLATEADIARLNPEARRGLAEFMRGKDHSRAEVEASGGTWIEPTLNGGQAYRYAPNPGTAVPA